MQNMFYEMKSISAFSLTEQSVENTDDVWFINYYSTQCSHCHDLAPTVGDQYWVITESRQYLTPTLNCYDLGSRTDIDLVVQYFAPNYA